MTGLTKLIKINVEKQQLEYLEDDQVVCCYRISTARNGLGEKCDSEKTPRGWHVVSEKIGADEPLGTVFVARQKTGEIYNLALSERFPDRDWILSRIIRLKGLEKGQNLGGDVDSFSRFIYIHGTACEEKLGTPSSRGCIRMGNNDIIELFDKINCQTKVFIGA